MLIIKILTGLAFISSVAWFIAQRDYEPAIAIATSLSAFIAAWLGDKKMKRQANQNQTVAESGIGIQAGGDVSTGGIRASRKTTNVE
jgi:integral membrane sensor domain MASE1